MVPPLQTARALPSASRTRGALSSVRGLRRVRGRGRVGSIHISVCSHDPDSSTGWTLACSKCTVISVEKKYADMVLKERTRLLCKTALDKMKLDCSVRDIAPDRSDFVISLNQKVLMQLTYSTNILSCES